MSDYDDLVTQIARQFERYIGDYQHHDAFLSHMVVAHELTKILGVNADVGTIADHILAKTFAPQEEPEPCYLVIYHERRTGNWTCYRFEDANKAIERAAQLRLYGFLVFVGRSDDAAFVEARGRPGPPIVWRRWIHDNHAWVIPYHHRLSWLGGEGPGAITTDLTRAVRVALGRYLRRPPAHRDSRGAAITYPYYSHAPVVRFLQDVIKGVDDPIDVYRIADQIIARYYVATTPPRDMYVVLFINDWREWRSISTEMQQDLQQHVHFAYQNLDFRPVYGHTSDGAFRDASNRFGPPLVWRKSAIFRDEWVIPYDHLRASAEERRNLLNRQSAEHGGARLDHD
ncbi:MAG: hypothetical protein C4321_00730 [Chloroflexota bacterium]